MLKIGILGGGQLGRMLLQEGANYPVETWVMDSDASCPAAALCQHFVAGDIKHFEDVMAFGAGLDILTIEIESVNADALDALQNQGKFILPQPHVLRTIQNKIHQKDFYHQHQIPSPAYVVTNNRDELMRHVDFLPAVHKLATGGYDGRGVQLLYSEKDLLAGFDAPAVLEKMVVMEKEIAVLVAMDTRGHLVLYPPVEMVADPILNLLDYQLCPALLPEPTKWKAEAIAIQTAKAFGSPGLYAIEMMVDRQGDVWVNETAPRVHNSGHHTIEAHYTSQYDMLWRIMLGYPLGSTDAISPSALVNLVGSPGHSGVAEYPGLSEVLAMEGAYVHIYGKTQTRPGRKMGHTTLLAGDRIDLIRKAKMVKENLKVTAKR